MLPLNVDIIVDKKFDLLLWVKRTMHEAIEKYHRLQTILIYLIIFNFQNMMAFGSNKNAFWKRYEHKIIESQF